MTRSEKELFDTKLSSLTTLMNAHFHNVNDDLKDIKVQTTKTNSRVTIIEKDLEEYRMIKKYPKIVLIIIIFFVIMAIVSIKKSFEVSKKIDETEQNIKIRIDNQEGISKVTRDGYVKYNDSGLSDSVKIK